MKSHVMVIGLLCAMLFVLADSQAVKAQPESRTRTFTVEKGGNLEVSLGSGEVVITGWDKNEVSVKVEGISEKDFSQVSMAQKGNAVSIVYRSRSGWFASGGRFDIMVPTEFNVTIKTAGGGIDVSGIAHGRIKGSSSGGDIRLKNLGTKVEMTTAGGDIRSDDIRGDAILKTSGGDIRTGDILGFADLVTAGGDVRVRNVGKGLKVRTAGGDIIVEDVGGDVFLTTAGGDVRVKRVSGGASLTTAGGDLILGSARGEVVAKTAGGDIRLSDVVGRVEAKTAGGKIDVELMPSGDGSSNLVTAGGDVRLFLPSEARATVEARILLQGNWKRLVERYTIHSDFPSSEFELNDRNNEIRGTFILNGGGHTVMLRTVNSNIEIKSLKK